MKTVALISGGKDSILAILIAMRYGHVPIVVANVTPSSSSSSSDLPEDADDVNEVDSYMFQTVGHEAVAKIAECMELPLRRSSICRGQSKDQSLLYSSEPDADDEVEEMYRLLKAVKDEFPMVEGVTTGAILSNYQRHRVELVCRRLGLVSLSYLWQRKPYEILDMVSQLRVEAILVKTASIGLSPKKLLGRTLESARPVLEEMEALYGSHMAGEGGEFETIVVDCPLYKRSYLRVVSKEVVMVDENEYSPSGHCILSVEVVPKDEAMLSADAEVMRLLMDPTRCVFPSDVMEGMPPSSQELLLGEDTVTAQSISDHTSTAEHLGPLPTRRFVVPEADGDDAYRSAVSRVLGDIFAWIQANNLECLMVAATVPAKHCVEPFTAAYEASVNAVAPPCLSLIVSEEGCSSSTVLDVLYASSQSGSNPILHTQSHSCWAAGRVGPYTQARAAFTDGGVNHVLCGAVLGLLPVTGKVATTATCDVPDKWIQHRLLTAHGALASEAFVQMVYACANLHAYLGFFKKSLASVTHQVVYTTYPDVVPLIPSMWEWCSGEPWAQTGVSRCVVVVDALPMDALVSMVAAVTVAPEVSSTDSD